MLSNHKWKGVNMKVTEKKVYELIHFLNSEIEDCREIEQVDRSWNRRKFALQDVKDYIMDLFDIEQPSDDDDSE